MPVLLPMQYHARSSNKTRLCSAVIGFLLLKYMECISFISDTARINDTDANAIYLKIAQGLKRSNARTIDIIRLVEFGTTSNKNNDFQAFEKAATKIKDMWTNPKSEDEMYAKANVERPSRALEPREIIKCGAYGAILERMLKVLSAIDEPLAGDFQNLIREKYILPAGKGSADKAKIKFALGKLGVVLRKKKKLEEANEIAQIFNPNLKTNAKIDFNKIRSNVQDVWKLLTGFSRNDNVAAVRDYFDNDDLQDTLETTVKDIEYNKDAQKIGSKERTPKEKLAVRVQKVRFALKNLYLANNVSNVAGVTMQDVNYFEGIDKSAGTEGAALLNQFKKHYDKLSTRSKDTNGPDAIINPNALNTKRSEELKDMKSDIDSKRGTVQLIIRNDDLQNKVMDVATRSSYESLYQAMGSFLNHRLHATNFRFNAVKIDKLRKEFEKLIQEYSALNNATATQNAPGLNL